MSNAAEDGGDSRGLCVVGELLAESMMITSARRDRSHMTSTLRGEVGLPQKMKQGRLREVYSVLHIGTNEDGAPGLF